MKTSLDDYRGSRRHVLEWVSNPEFLSEINDMLAPVGAVIPPAAPWKPRGITAPDEARLETLSSEYLPTDKRDELRSWWLKHEAGANTPNWDFLSPCLIDGKPGLLLIEAKANKRELSKSGKRAPNPKSTRSIDNHDQICAAIKEASDSLSREVSDISLSASNHYQLANRIAFAWKLASMGIPVVLVYLAFTGDNGIRDAGEPFSDHKDWRELFEKATRDIFPPKGIGERISCGPASFRLMVESRPALSDSPPPRPRKKG